MAKDCVSQIYFLNMTSYISMIMYEYSCLESAGQYCTDDTNLIIMKFLWLQTDTCHLSTLMYVLCWDSSKYDTENN